VHVLIIDHITAQRLLEDETARKRQGGNR
jgi:hypothetical protein